MPEPKAIKIFLLYFFLSLSIHSVGQNNTIKYLNSYQSSLGSSTAVLSGVNGINGNPAGISDESLSYSLFANSEQRFFLNSLNSSSLGGIIRIGSYDFIGMSFANFGIEEFQEQKIGLSYSRKIGAKTFIGSTANFYNFQIDEYGKTNDIEINFGLKSGIGKDISYGVYLENIFATKTKGYLREKTLVSLGLIYKLSEKVFMLVEAKSDISDNTSFILGINYQILDNLGLQFGVNSNEGGPSFGLNYKFNDRFKLIGSVRSSQNLGITPSFGIVYSSVNR